MVADVNRDGRLDVLVGNVGNDCPQNGNCVGDGTVGVLLGNGNGTFQTAVTYDAGSGSTISMAVADLNGDGKLDLAVANNGTSVLLGNGDGIFQPAQSYAGGGCCQILVADLNLDGRPDLLNVAGTSTAVNLYLGKGDGTFEAPQTVSLGGTEFSRVTVADVNEDRKPDLLAANWCADPCSGQEGTVGVLLNNTQTDTTPPVITLAAAPKILWPPKGKMVPVRVSGTITDTGSGVNVSSAAYSVTDEYGEVQPAAGISLGAGGSYSFTVLLQASRLGSDLDGRQYTITVRASDNAGNSASQASVVTVPHDRGE